jgi:acyl-phosphate glycerol 3-phosphate acyltransferase
MNDVAALAVTALAAYLLGAVPFGYLVARARGVDILKVGSGNIGATNVGRVLGRKLGVLVFLLDSAKGAVPVALVRWLQPSTDPAVFPGPDALPVAAGLAAFLGHLFPVYLGFRGGKGVATGAGVVAVLLPGPTAVALLAWLAVALATRYVSLASMVAAAALSVFRLLTEREPFAPGHVILTLFCFTAAVLVFVRHRANISRLIGGTENQLREGPTMLMFAKVVHVLAVGLWFGSVVFFTFVVGLTLFGTFSQLTELPKDQRPLWLPVPPELDRELTAKTFPTPLRKEQGSRIAGAAVGPMFTWYYATQLVCAVLALATALAWWGTAGGDNRTRVIVVGVALVTVAGGWLLERKVEALRVTRTETSDAVLRAASPTPDQVIAAEQARSEFGRYHGYSLLMNFLTVILVTVAMALAASLPTRSESVSLPTPERQESGSVSAVSA